MLNLFFIKQMGLITLPHDEIKKGEHRCTHRLFLFPLFSVYLFFSFSMNFHPPAIDEMIPRPST